MRDRLYTTDTRRPPFYIVWWEICEAVQSMKEGNVWSECNPVVGNNTADILNTVAATGNLSKDMENSALMPVENPGNSPDTLNKAQLFGRHLSFANCNLTRCKLHRHRNAPLKPDQTWLLETPTAPLPLNVLSKLTAFIDVIPALSASKVFWQ